MSKKTKLALYFSIMFSFLLSFLKCDGKVFAATVPEPFQAPYYYDSSVTSETYDNLKTQLISMFERCNLDSDDFYMFYRMLNQSHFMYIFDKQGTYKNLTYSSDPYINFHSTRYAVVNTQSLGSINSLTFYDNANSYVPFFLSYNTVQKFYTVTQISNYGNDGTFFNAPVNYTGSVFISNLNYVAPYVPENYEVVNLPFYSLDVDDFYEWLVNNDKIAIDSSGNVSGKIPSYIGVQKLKSFLSFYKEFGSSNKNFMQKIGHWFSFMNIFGQTRDNKAILKNTIDSLYQEYIEYISGTHAYWPSATKIQERQNIDTVTKDNNTTLITDDSNDTLDISILRDILRGVIAISNNVNDGVGKILGALARLNFVVNVTNEGGAVPSPTVETDINYTDQGNFGIDEIHQYEPLPEAPDIDGDVDFLEYPAVLAESTNAFFNLLPSDMSALMSAVLVLGVLITKIGR